MQEQKRRMTCSITLSLKTSWVGGEGILPEKASLHVGQVFTSVSKSKCTLIGTHLQLTEAHRDQFWTIWTSFIGLPYSSQDICGLVAEPGKVTFLDYSVLIGGCWDCNWFYGWLFLPIQTLHSRHQLFRCMPIWKYASHTVFNISFS